MTTKIALIVCLLAAGSFGNVQAEQIFRLDVAARNVAYSTRTQKIYATIPSTAAAAYANRVLEISPLNGTITNSILVGGDPNAIAVSPDLAVAYVGLDADGTVLPIDLTTMMPGSPFAIGNSPISGLPLTAQQMLAIPGMPGTLVITRSNGTSFGGIVVFDNGVARPTIIATKTGGNSIALDVQPNIVYGFSNDSSDFKLYRMIIDAAGISAVASVSNVITGFNVKIAADAGTIFATTGRTADGATLNPAGSYASSGPIVFDHSARAVVFGRADSLDLFDQETFIPIRSVLLDDGLASSLVKSATTCGTGCVAVVNINTSTRIYVVRDLFDRIFRAGFE